MAMQPPTTPGQRSSAEGSAPQGGLDNDSRVKTLKALGLPVTRQNYIELLHGRAVPAEEWTPEHEMDLPPELRQ